MKSFLRALLLWSQLYVAPALALEVQPGSQHDSSIVVASKNFGENYLLGEIVAQTLEASGFLVERKFGLGGTLICYEALVSGEVDVYVEYTGTLSQAILEMTGQPTLDEIRTALPTLGLELLAPFGFNNTYALVLKQARADQKGLTEISDLSRFPELNLVVSHEFLERPDGWPGLAERYGLKNEATGIEHGLAYQAIEEGSIDVTDAYSTDGELERYDLVILDDNRGFFPSYLAAPLVRADIPSAAKRAIGVLGASLDAKQMQTLNGYVVYDERSFAEVAAEFLTHKGIIVGSLVGEHSDSTGFVSLLPKVLPKIWKNTLVHLKLTGVALVSAIVVGVLLGLAIFRRPALGKAVIYFCGLLQTIPSIALLALMIPLFGIGVWPAIIALFLYSLLPILRNTVTALTTVDPALVRVGEAMGLTANEQIRHLFLPLSMPSILAGIRTAAVISIGTATLAAFIGAGGLGDPIVTGLSLNNVNMILQGAIPAAVLAVVVELLFEAVERVVLPGHLRRLL